MHLNTILCTLSLASLIYAVTSALVRHWIHFAVGVFLFLSSLSAMVCFLPPEQHSYASEDFPMDAHAFSGALLFFYVVLWTSFFISERIEKRPPRPLL